MQLKLKFSTPVDKNLLVYASKTAIKHEKLSETEEGQVKILGVTKWGQLKIS